MRPPSSLTTVSTLAAVIQLMVMLGWTHPASASQVSVDQTDQSYRIAVTDIATHVDYPSVVVIESATLTTKDPNNEEAASPKGLIYLTLDLSARPVQGQFGDPTWGDFYSNMTPLPATALRYVTASGRSFVSTRIDVNPRASFANADGDDGLVDATYYFTVPITDRGGVLEILSSRTSGTQYENFVGIGTTTLVTGGPMRIALHFPNLVTVVARSQPTSAPGTPRYTTFASMLNFVSTILGLLLLASAYLWIRRARRRKYKSYRSRNVVHDEPAPSPESPNETVTVVTPTSPMRRVEESPLEVITDDKLHVNVLGSLTISQTDGPSSDPVRAIVAYLAMHTERALTLDEIQNAIWPLTDKGNDIKRPAMHNYMAHARKAVGEQHLPTASGRPGYQLVDSTTDWNEFQALLTQAGRTEKGVARELRRQALSLVRGEPFTADTSRYFTWAFSSAVVYKIVESVTGLAHSLGTELVLTGDLAGAEWALRQGLLCDPASLTLWEGLTDVLLETADESLLVLHWKAASLVLESKIVVALRTRENG